ncbi:MAG: transglutaminase domain-containing protein [Deltaproteobacteria bacterium]|nr:transglutaminase domain-containing protein [Deltaproteobacteria bacterium]
MADRWGQRARSSVEIMDAFGQMATEDKGPLHALKQKFPGKEIMIKATGRDGEHDQFLFCVKGPQGKIEDTYTLDGEMNLIAFKKPRSSEEPVLFRATVNDDGSFNIDVQKTPRIVRKYPLQTPYSLGDSVDVPFFDSSVTEDWEDGKPFRTQNKVLEGKISGFDGKGTYDVSFTQPDGKESIKKMTLGDLKKYNNPHFFMEKSSYFSDVNININTDKELAGFLEGADSIINKHLPQDGSLAKMAPGELVKHQKAFIDEVMGYVRDTMKYPTSKDHSPDDASKTYHDLNDGYGRFDLGKLVKIKRGVCRHQCILEHLVMQRAGIDSRLASGSANTGGGDYRGLHIWMEVALADNSRYLSDQTWSDATIPLWNGAYDSDKRRVEMYHRTARYDSRVVG